MIKMFPYCLIRMITRDSKPALQERAKQAKIRL